MSERNQLKRLVITQEFLLDLLDPEVRPVNSLPDDAEFVRMYEVPARDTYEFLFKSDSFEPVPEGEEIPELRFEFRDLHTYEV